MIHVLLVTIFFLDRHNVTVGQQINMELVSIAAQLAYCLKSDKFQAHYVVCCILYSAIRSII